MASDKFKQRLYDHGTTHCVLCGDSFTESKPCCCDDGCSDDGTLHIDGRCVRCCHEKSSTYNSQDGRGGYERGE